MPALSGMNDIMSLEFSEPVWEDVSGFKIFADKTKIFIAGDSTACNYPHTGTPNRCPRTGWGQVFGELFDSDIQVVNCAISGRSSKSFLKELNFKFISEKISEGDYLIIQFAHNDCKESDKSRYTSPDDNSYQECLYKYIYAARNAGAHPILATSITRNVADDNTLVPYCEALKELGEKENIPVLDIYSLSREQLLTSPEVHTSMYMVLEPQDKRFTDLPDFVNSEYYESGSVDNTHLNINGARYIAKLAARELLRLNHPLAEHLL